MLTDFEELEFQISSIFKTYHNQGYFNVPPRSFAALSLRLKGCGRFNFGDKQLISDEGDLLFVPANTPYKVEYSVSEMIVIHFKSCNYHTAECFTPRDSEKFKEMFIKLADSWSQNRSSHSAKSRIYGLLDALASENTQGASRQLFKQSIEYLENNFHKSDVNVEKMCAFLHVSRSTLQREFIKHGDFSPQQYLIRLRLNRAFEMLSNNALSVKEISEICGFYDDKYFSRSFKKAYGISPSDVKKHTHI